MDVFDSVDPLVINIANVNNTNTQLKLSQFAESITYIKLSEEPLLGDILGTNIRVFEDTIYIDCENIYKYTPTGEFLRKLFVNGQGPKETMKWEFFPAAYNKKERYVTFANRSNNYVSYSFDGVFLGTSDYKIGNDTHKQETYFNDYSVYRIEHNAMGNRLGPFLFYAKNIFTDSVFYAYPNPAADENPSPNGFSVQHPSDMNFINIDSTLWFKHYVLDTLYSTNDFITITPRYIFKTDNTFMNLREYTYNIVNALDRERSRAKVIMGILPLPSGGLLYTIDKKIALADREGNTSDCCEKPIINDIDNYLKEIDFIMPLICRTFYVSNNHVYILIDAFKFFEVGNTLPPSLKDLDADSNPIVLKIKLKI